MAGEPVVIGGKRQAQRERQYDLKARSANVRQAIYDVDMTTIELQEVVKYLLDVVDELAERIGATEDIT